MPVQRAKSGLMAKYGANLDKAVKDHAADETSYGFTGVPAGINNGIAKLTDAYFDVYKSGDNEGEYYFRAAGVVVEPQSITENGREMPVAGLQTSIMEPVCDTTTSNGKTTSQEEHVARILNHMRKLGADTENASGADLETLAAALKEASPYFRFSTSPRKDQTTNQVTGVWENWNGIKGVENYETNGAVDAVQDNTGAAEAPAAEDASDDLDAMATAADGGDDTAIEKLTELALAAGATQEAVEGAANWTAVVGMIRGETAAEEPAGDEPWEPKKEEVYKFFPVDPKTKKPGKKGVEVEVTAVDKKGETVDLKNTANHKIVYKKVKWSALESPE